MNPDIPHIEQYSGAWAMHEPAFLAMVAQVERMDIAAHVRARIDGEIQGDGEPFTTVDGIAVIDIVGTMTKFGSSLSDTPGSVTLRKVVREAAADNSIRGILLRFDSGGGTVAGTDDLAQDVARALTVKPVVAYIEDMCASAAYYVASQCGRVVANESAIIGGIGTFMAIRDFSALFDEAGVKVHVIKSGEFKGAGEEGTVITDAQLAEFQRTVDSFGGLFVAAVARGRGMSEKAAKSLADGRVHVGAEAIPLKLIDAVETIEDTMATLIAAADARERTPAIGAGVGPLKGLAMTESDVTVTSNLTQLTSEPKAATVAELRKAFPACNAAFREECTELGATLADAHELWAGHVTEANAKLAEDNKAQADKIAELEAAAKAKEEAPGVEALGVSAGAEAKNVSSDPSAQWKEALAGKMKEVKDKGQAMAAVVREQPELHQAYLDTYNAEHQQHRRRVV